MADKLVIKIDGDDSGFQKSLSGIENIAKKGLGTALKGITAAGTGFTIATGAALKFSGELEQNIGGSEAVFGKFADNIQKKADKAFKNMGLSTANYLATANKMGSLFKGAGFEVEEAVNITSEAMQRAADVASIMGIDTTWAMESIAGAAKGNFTMMDNLGVAMNDTTLNAYALEKGLGKTTQQMTNQEKIALAMEMFLERTAYAAGNYAKENETLAGSLSTAKAALENYLSGTGDVKELEESLKNASTVIVKNIKDLAPGLAEGLIEIVRGLIPVVPEILVELLPSIIDAIEGLFKEATEVVPEFIDELADGVGDAVPVLKPITSLISLLADNIDILTIAVASGTTAVVTYRGALLTMSIVQQITSWLEVTRKAFVSYNAALAANTAMATTGATVNGLLLSTLTPLQLVYGVLTGKIKLADAAQAKFNITVLKNPYALAAAALATLVAGVIAYAATHKSKSEEILDSLKDLRESHEEAIKSIDKTASAERAEAESALLLKDKLYELEGQIKSGTLTQQEAEQAQEEFNTAAGKMEKLIPGITDNLFDETGEINIQKQAVDDLTQSYYDLAIAKSMVNAYQSKMDETAKALVDAKEAQKEAQDNYDNKVDYYSKDKFVVGTGSRRRGALGAYKTIENFEVNRAKNALNETNKAVADLEAEYKGYFDSMSEYEKQIKEMVGETTKNLKKGNGEKVTSTKTTSKKQSDILKEQFERDLKNLQLYHDNGLVSDEKYYKKLAELRNEYLEEGSEDWNEYTDEIFDYYNNMLSEAKDNAISKFEDITNAQKDLAKKLKDSTNRTFEQYSIVEKGKETTYSKLADVGASNKQLEQYSALLDRLYEKREELPENLSDTLASMDVSDAILYLNELLGASDTEFEKYMADLEKNAQLTEKISGQVYSSEFEEFKSALEEEFGQLPEDFFEIGTESAEKYGEGFMDTLKIILDNAKVAISTTLSGLSNNFVFAGAGGANTSSYTDARTTTIIAPSSSAHDIVEAEKQNAIFQEHTSGFGG